jgi:hypothetical protein
VVVDGRTPVRTEAHRRAAEDPIAERPEQHDCRVRNMVIELKRSSTRRDAGALRDEPLDLATAS